MRIEKNLGVSGSKVQALSPLPYCLLPPGRLPFFTSLGPGPYDASPCASDTAPSSWSLTSFFSCMLFLPCLCLLWAPYPYHSYIQSIGSYPYFGPRTHLQTSWKLSLENALCICRYACARTHTHTCTLCILFQAVHRLSHLQILRLKAQLCGFKYILCLLRWSMWWWLSILIACDPMDMFSEVKKCIFIV